MKICAILLLEYCFNDKQWTFDFLELFTRKRGGSIYLSVALSQFSDKTLEQGTSYLFYSFSTIL